MSWIKRLLAFSIAVALANLCWVFASRYAANRRLASGPDAEQTRRQAELDRMYSGTGVRILQFYAPEAEVAKGGRTTLCYGVLNARTLRIEPPVEGVGVSLSRCVEVAPKADTRYTLTAEGRDGSTVSASLTLKVRN